MNKAACTRRWSFSLRSVFIGIAVVSVLCGWILHHRRKQILQRDRLIAMFQARDSSLGFRYGLWGWEPACASWWFEQVAFPKPDSVSLRAAEGQPLPDAFCETARRCRKVEYNGSAGGEDDFLRRCTSANTQEITVIRNGVSGDCLAFARGCPNLRKVTCGFVVLRSKSLSALLSHSGVEELEFCVTADDLSRVEALQAPGALQRLVIDFQSDPVTFVSEAGDTPVARLLWERPPSGEFAWLRQCTQLKEITFTMSVEAAFLSAVGRHLQGVERTNLPSAGGSVLDTLASWPRLRWLCLDGAELTDSLLTQVLRSCPNLHTLEIDEYSSSRVDLSPEALQSLSGLAGLRRLRLGGCNLTALHVKNLARISQLEEVSLEDQGLDDATLAPLGQLPKLKRISLSRTRASQTLFREIRGDWDTNRPWRN